jgi:hypothetical protein
MRQPPLMRREAVHWSILPLLIFTPIASHAQASFDIDRAFILDSMVYEPFNVAKTRPLRRALDEGIINAATPLLVMEHRAGRLAFAVDQLAYHHVAQGEIEGEPWMVSF